MGNPILYIVIPCYNEEAVLPLTSGMFLKKIKDLAAAGKISDKSRILFVNDGSKDKTWDIIRSLAEADEHNRPMEDVSEAFLLNECNVPFLELCVMLQQEFSRCFSTKK